MDILRENRNTDNPLRLVRSPYYHNTCCLWLVRLVINVNHPTLPICLVKDIKNWLISQVHFWTERDCPLRFLTQKTHTDIHISHTLCWLTWHIYTHIHNIHDIPLWYIFYQYIHMLPYIHTYIHTWEHPYRQVI